MTTVHNSYISAIIGLLHLKYGKQKGTKQTKFENEEKKVSLK